MRPAACVGIRSGVSMWNTGSAGLPSKCPTNVSVLPARVGLVPRDVRRVAGERDVRARRVEPGVRDRLPVVEQVEVIAGRVEARDEHRVQTAVGRALIPRDPRRRRLAGDHRAGRDLRVLGAVAVGQACAAGTASSEHACSAAALWAHSPKRSVSRLVGGQARRRSWSCPRSRGRRPASESRRHRSLRDRARGEHHVGVEQSGDRSCCRCRSSRTRRPMARCRWRR